MTQIRFKGFGTGSNLGTVSATVGADSGSVNISAFQAPTTVTTLPRISDGFDTDTLNVDTAGLTGITAYAWREVGETIVLSTGSAFMGTGSGGKYVECEVTCDQGVLVSPPIMVYSSTMMGMAMDPAHLADDASIVFLVPHNEATHIAVANGDWTDAATWMNGRVPKNGARALVPHGITVTYNNAGYFRFDWVRVDGVLTWALDRSTFMLAEHIVGTRGSEIIQGTAGNRLPPQHKMEMVISGKHYRDNTFEPTDINLARDPALWGRGIISQGVWRMWGADKETWCKAWPIEAGATSADLQYIGTTGWEVGDDIVILGTSASDPGGSPPMVTEDETRTITDITGSVVSWDVNQPLIYPHKNQAVGSTRTDLYPNIMLHKGRNIEVRSEITSPVRRRGHTANVHHSCTVDMWDGDFINLGRTDKSRSVGRKDENGDFYFHNDLVLLQDGLETAPFDEQSNIAARYPVHMHHVGFGHMGARPIVNSCQVFNTPGWGMVHHACDVDFERCGIYDFWGAGMVAESGNELGGWVSNIAAHAVTTGGGLGATAKLTEGGRGLAGDNFKGGEGFAYRGRAVRAVGNVSNSCCWGNVFYHRVNIPVFPAKSLLREYVDLEKVGLINQKFLTSYDKFDFQAYPIIHFADNESVACLGGLSVTKQTPQQGHDVNVKFKRFKCWGFVNDAVQIEYVAPYILEDFDIVGLGVGVSNEGITFGPNTFHMTVINARVEGCRTGFDRAELSTVAASNVYSAADPRWHDIANDYIELTDDITFKPYKAAERPTPYVTGPESLYTDDNFDGTSVDYGLAPSNNLPLVLGNWTGANSFIDVVTNADGRKSSNLPMDQDVVPKLWDDFVFFIDGAYTRRFAQDQGYWQTDLGNGLENVLLIQEIFSDPVTGRPQRGLNFIKATGSMSGLTDNGTFNHTLTPTVQADKLATVAAGGSVVIDVVTGATGGDGTTYTLVDNMSIKPDHGVAILDAVNGTIAYTPDSSHVIGTDEMYVFVESGGQSATVRIDILIGDGGAVSEPTVPTVTDHVDANTIGVQLLAPPSTGGRRIDLVQYSTDAGATWRRLTHGWVQAVHKVTVESDGTAIAAGSYDVQIRYKTNYDYTYSGASAPEAVTVT